MLTIFTVPLPFAFRDAVSQHNAITSWMLLDPQPEILLLGDETGVSEFAYQNGLRHRPDLERNELGDFSIQSIFQVAIEQASYDVLALIDADTILMNDFLPVVQRVFDTNPHSMLCGRRNAAHIPFKIDFSPGWEQALRILVDTTGRQFRGKGAAGSDYFVFPRDLFIPSDIPDFSLGRGHWDGWAMWHPLYKGYELVDCTNVIFPIHQTHRWRRYQNTPGSTRNLEMALGEQAWVHDATWIVNQADLSS